MSADDEANAQEGKSEKPAGAHPQQDHELPVGAAVPSKGDRAGTQQGREEEKKRAYKHDLDPMLTLQRRIVAFTFLSLVVSAVAMMFTGVQSYEAVTGAVTAQRHAEAAAALARAAQTTARVAVAQARIAERQVLAANRQADAAAAQVDIARASLRAQIVGSRALSGEARSVSEMNSLSFQSIRLAGFISPAAADGTTAAYLTIANKSSPITMQSQLGTIGIEPISNMLVLNKAAYDFSKGNKILKSMAADAMQRYDLKLQKPTSSEQQDIDKDRAVVVLRSGILYQDQYKRTHHAYFCIVRVRDADGSTLLKVCPTPPDD